jgi:hypothetical protein
MDNAFTQARLKVPKVPADFASKAGSSKSDLAQAIFDLLQGARILGINIDEPNNFDLGELTNRITALEDGHKTNLIQQRVVSNTGVANGTLIFTFDDMQTTNYVVNVCFITPDTGPAAALTWSLVANSKTGTQCTIFIKGDATAYQVELTVTENKALVA